MLENTIFSLLKSGVFNIKLLSRSNICMFEIILQKIKNIKHFSENTNLKIIIDDSDLNDSLTNHINGKKNIMIIMSDIPLINHENMKKIIDLFYNEYYDISIIPSHRGGTNILFFKDVFNFKTKYNGLSFLNHIKEAKIKSMNINIIDTFFLSIDLDQLDDIIEVLIHGKNKVKKYLKSIFSIDEYGNLIREI